LRGDVMLAFDDENSLLCRRDYVQLESSEPRVSGWRVRILGTPSSTCWRRTTSRQRSDWLPDRWTSSSAITWPVRYDVYLISVRPMKHIWTHVKN